jgi:hypothetical protein
MIQFAADNGIAHDYLTAVMNVDPNASTFYLGYPNSLSAWVADMDGDKDVVDVFDHFRRADGKIILRLRFRRKITDFDDGFLDVIYEGVETN